MLLLDIDNIPFVKVNHQSGSKKVIFIGSDCDSPITQIAYGHLLAKEMIEEHVHPSMEEFFFFQSGTGYITIDGIKHKVSLNKVVRVPVGAKHMLSAETDLSFFYFGIEA